MIERKFMQGLNGEQTDPDTIWCGWMEEMPLSAVRTLTAIEWTREPDRIQPPFSLKDGGPYLPDVDAMESVEMVDLEADPPVVRRMVRIPYRLAGSKTLRQPGYTDRPAGR